MRRVHRNFEWLEVGFVGRNTVVRNALAKTLFTERVDVVLDAFVCTIIKRAERYALAAVAKHVDVRALIKVDKAVWALFFGMICLRARLQECFVGMYFQKAARNSLASLERKSRIVQLANAALQVLVGGERFYNPVDTHLLVRRRRAQKATRPTGGPQLIRAVVNKADRFWTTKPWLVDDMICAVSKPDNTRAIGDATQTTHCLAMLQPMQIFQAI